MPVPVITYLTGGGFPSRQPQATSRISPASTAAPARKFPFLFREQLRLTFIPINAKPATGNQPKEDGLKPPRVAAGTLSEAATAPAVTLTVGLALPAGSQVTEFELREPVSAPACNGVTD